jgi:hypothetical protein
MREHERNRLNLIDFDQRFGELTKQARVNISFYRRRVEPVIPAAIPSLNTAADDADPRRSPTRSSISRRRLRFRGAAARERQRRPNHIVATSAATCSATTRAVGRLRAIRVRLSGRAPSARPRLSRADARGSPDSRAEAGEDRRARYGALSVLSAFRIDQFYMRRDRRQDDV